MDNFGESDTCWESIRSNVQTFEDIKSSIPGKAFAEGGIHSQFFLHQDFNGFFHFRLVQLFGIAALLIQRVDRVDPTNAVGRVNKSHIHWKPRWIPVNYIIVPIKLHFFI